MPSQSRPITYGDVAAFVVALAAFTVHGWIRFDGVYDTGTTILGAFGVVVAVVLTVKISLR